MVNSCSYTLNFKEYSLIFLFFWKTNSLTVKRDKSYFNKIWLFNNLKLLFSNPKLKFFNNSVDLFQNNLNNLNNTHFYTVNWLLDRSRAFVNAYSYFLCSIVLHKICSNRLVEKRIYYNLSKSIKYKNIKIKILKFLRLCISRIKLKMHHKEFY